MDGTGIQEIPDRSLAQRLREKVNGFNLRVGAQGVAVTLAFVLLPELLS